MRFARCLEFSGEDELASPEQPLQTGDELAAKHAAEHPDRQEEAGAWVDPARVIRRETAGRDDAMDVRMMQQILSPSVQDAQEADLRAQVFRIGGDLEQRLRAGAEQQTIERPSCSEAPATRVPEAA